MRQIFILTMCLSTIFQAFATRISEDSAFQKALEFAAGRTVKNINSATDPKRVVGSATSKNYYVFNIGEDDGFVIISGDDRTRPVLGYSDTGHFDSSNIPTNMQWLLDAYNEVIDGLNIDNINLPVKASVATSTLENPNIRPLITTTWGQHAPYNTKCPSFNGQQCLTGCVATGMAQLMNYHQWPKTQTTAVDGYTSIANKINVPKLPERVFDWDKMDVTNEDNEVADLMRYCGQSVTMNYGPYASSSSYLKSLTALRDNFHFSKGMLYEDRNQYSNEEWSALIYDQLQKGIPILYCGLGPGSNSGHAFILDGFENGLYHFNWGWDGNYDGYYSLDELTPTQNNNYSYNQCMVSYACPPVNAEDSTRSKIVVKSISCNKTNLSRTEGGPISLTALIEGDMTSDASVYIGFALWNGTEIVELLLGEECEFTSDSNDLTHSDNNIYIRNSVPEGNYQLIAVNRLNESETWLPDTRSHSRYIDVTISETEIQLRPIKKSESGIEINNFGSFEINGLVYLLTSESDVFRAYLQSPTGDTTYSGDITVPDYVEYDSFKFKVFGEEGRPLSDKNDVTSISSPISLKISNCHNLERIEYREGVLKSEKIEGCPELTKVILPSSCRVIEQISDCPALKEICFMNLYPSSISLDERGRLWTKESLPGLTDIFFYGDEPPALTTSVPSDNADLKIHIPKGMKESFIACGWEGWNVIDDLESLPETVKWDYVGTDEDINDGLIFSYGSNDVEVAMKISSNEFEKIVGNKIVAIEYFTPKSPEFFSIKSTAREDIARNPDYVFITENGKDYVIKQSTSAVRGSWTRVILENPYEISGEDIFIGVGRKNTLSMSWANYDTKAGGFWYRPMGDDNSQAPDEIPGTWYHNCGEEDFNFPMPIRAIIQGDNLPSDIAILNAEYEKNDEKPLSEGGIVSMKIRNLSPRLVKDLGFNFDYDGKSNESVITSNPLPANHIATITVKPKDLKFNAHFIKLSATSIDGKTDAVDSNSTETITLLSTDLEYYPRVTVLEESTSRLDGACANTIAIKEDMKKRFPDNLLAISLHSDNEMKVADGSYDEFLKGTSAYYAFNVNRSGWQIALPFNNEISNVKDKGEALIKSEAEYSKDGRINILSNFAFNKNHAEDDDFEIAYVLIENQVGPFEQMNNLSGDSRYDYDYHSQYWWVHQDKKVMYLFDDVARTIHTISGEECLFPSEIVKDEVYESSYCMKIPAYVQNCDDLKVVTLLIDKKSGEIINSDRAVITGDTPDLSAKLGDSNCNGEINIADAVNIANYVVGREVEKFSYTPSDVNNDGNLSFADASATVSLILDLPNETSSSYARIRRDEQATEADMIHIEGISAYEEGARSIYITLENTRHYVALQADLLLSENIDIDAIKIGKRVENTHKLAIKRVDENTVRVIIFDINNRTFTVSDDPILEIMVKNQSGASRVDIRNIIASDAAAHEYLLSTDNATSGVFGIGGMSVETCIELIPGRDILEIKNAESKLIRISTVDGKEVISKLVESNLERINLTSGLYIVKVGNVAKKVMVK